jgi:hypothetical protein
MTGQGTILVVDDTTESLRVLVEILQSEGYKVRPANSGELALAAIAAQSPDLILLDIRMPGLDGFEVCRRLKAEEATRKIPVIFQSAATDLADRLEGLRLGAVDYISKPFQREELLARVRTQLELAQLRGDLEELVRERTAQLEAEIAERKRAEEEIRQLNERFSLATRASHLGVWDWDMQKNELVWDKGMYALYGVNQEDFQDAYAAWLQGVHPDDRDLSDKISQQAQRGEREYDTEFRVVWPDGSIRWLKAYGQSVRDAEGKPLRMTGINFDITDQRKAEKEIRKLNQELEHRVTERTAQLQAANQELEAFCYSVSHDLRAPLRHVDGYIELLVSHCRDDLSDKGLHYLDTIAASARQMGVLIDDLLQLSRTGRAELRQEKIDMNQVLQEALAPVQEACAGRSMEWVIGELPAARGDAALLRQVWANLLGNAIKFTKTREAARIEVSAQETDAEIVFVIADNGVGFDMQYAGKLFGVFQRLHSQEAFEGTGIGLATAQRIINRHGGRIWAEAEPNRGARFSFTLPKSEAFATKPSE